MEQPSFQFLAALLLSRCNFATAAEMWSAPVKASYSELLKSSPRDNWALAMPRPDPFSPLLALFFCTVLHLLQPPSVFPSQHIGKNSIAERAVMEDLNYHAS